MLALINHAQEQVAFASENCVDFDPKLDVIVEDVERCLTEHDSVLGPILLQYFALIFKRERLSAPLLIKGLHCVVKVADIDRGADGARHAVGASVACHADLGLGWDHPVVELVVERMLLSL